MEIQNPRFLNVRGSVKNFDTFASYGIEKKCHEGKIDSLKAKVNQELYTISKLKPGVS